MFTIADYNNFRPQSNARLLFRDKQSHNEISPSMVWNQEDYTTPFEDNINKSRRRRKCRVSLYNKESLSSLKLFVYLPVQTSSNFWRLNWSNLSNKLTNQPLFSPLFDSGLKLRWQNHELGNFGNKISWQCWEMNPPCCFAGTLLRSVHTVITSGQYHQCSG